ncbi:MULTISPECIES: GIY-YIG nuclease family protein [unclassified Legionella]|uniref:GIY-YIG nuclease family protein n=1 Tax=unclassified Legionella TaxID=2622702 RepID=UPI0010561763|nr:MULTISPECIES: GIY-YIG nuclease family protein [unclassified Legionella]MDI9819798.1 GIY-YIG nuclease family protein [Legionella sp. PL877]
MEKQYYVYILASKKYGALYVGFTSNLTQRNYEHRENLVDGFTKKYHVHELVYFEVHSNVYEAITSVSSRLNFRVGVWVTFRFM